MKNRTKLFIIPMLLVGMILMFTESCKKEENLAEITTTEVTDITETTAKTGGNITSDEGSAITTRGVCWSTSPDPTIKDNKTTDGTGGGSFTSNITNLEVNSFYYVRAYATNDAGTSYGATLTFTTKNAVTDIDGNLYDTIIIGNQIWLKENLKVSRFNNGDSIPNIKDGILWNSLNTAAYCDYDNDSNIGNIYGHLYNYFAVVDSRGICPVGWHVPSQKEWEELAEFIGTHSIAGAKLKEIGYKHWDYYPKIVETTNESGFTALGGGWRSYNNGAFANLKKMCFMWSTKQENDSSFFWALGHHHQNFFTGKNALYRGFSVRCIKD